MYDPAEPRSREDRKEKTFAPLVSLRLGWNLKGGV